MGSWPWPKQCISKCTIETCKKRCLCDAEHEDKKSHVCAGGHEW
jgi:hypothetical protein